MEKVFVCVCVCCFWFVWLFYALFVFLTYAILFSRTILSDTDSNSARLVFFFFLERNLTCARIPLFSNDNMFTCAYVRFTSRPSSGVQNSPWCIWHHEIQVKSQCGSCMCKQTRTLRQPSLTFGLSLSGFLPECRTPCPFLRRNNFTWAVQLSATWISTWNTECSDTAQGGWTESPRSSSPAQDLTAI